VGPIWGTLTEFVQAGNSVTVTRILFAYHVWQILAVLLADAFDKVGIRH